MNQLFCTQCQHNHLSTSGLSNCTCSCHLSGSVNNLPEVHLAHEYCVKIDRIETLLQEMKEMLSEMLSDRK